MVIIEVVSFDNYDRVFFSGLINRYVFGMNYRIDDRERRSVSGFVGQFWVRKVGTYKRCNFIYEIKRPTRRRVQLADRE